MQAPISQPARVRSDDPHLEDQAGPPGVEDGLAVAAGAGDSEREGGGAVVELVRRRAVGRCTHTTASTGGSASVLVTEMFLHPAGCAP